MNKYNIVTIKLVNILLTAFLLFLVHIIDKYVFIGFLPQLGYFILGYGLGYLLPPVTWVSIPYYEKTDSELNKSSNEG